MLTKADFDQIREIIREEVGNETQAMKDELQADITLSQMHIRGEIKDLQDRIKNFEIRLTKMHRELRSEIKIVLTYLEKDDIRIQKRVEKIEEQLRVSPS